jgi:hypothetical protein
MAATPAFSAPDRVRADQTFSDGYSGFAVAVSKVVAAK